jgi:hypothetical protein
MIELWKVSRFKLVAAMNYQIARDSNGLLHTNSCYDVVSAGVNPPQNEWIHMAVTYDGEILRLYLNGNLQVATLFTYGCETTDPLRFGTSGTCSIYQRFIGFIDEVRIWNITRTPEEIANSYNRIINPSTSGLVGYWNFDEDLTDQNVYDSSPLNNNGTMGATLSAGADDPTRIVSDAPLLTLDHDAAVVEILVPDDVVDFQSTIAPQVLVENRGLVTDTIPVTFQIGFDYNESSTITLLPGESGLVTFPEWYADDLGSIPIQASTSLPGDGATFNDKLQKVIAVTATTTAPVITKVSPDTGGNTSTVTVTIEGDNFQEGLGIKLAKVGEPEIPASSVTLVDPTKISAVFDLAGAEPGSWDIVVTNPDSKEVGIFPDGFIIESGGESDVWVDILGRPIIRSGRPAPFMVFYGNQGNIDVKEAVLWVAGIPNDADVDVSLSDSIQPMPDPEIESNEVSPVVFEIQGQRVIGVTLNSISPGETGNMNFSLNIPGLTSADFDVWLYTLGDSPSPLGCAKISCMPEEDQNGLEAAVFISRVYYCGPFTICHGGNLCRDAADNLAAVLTLESRVPGSKLAGWTIDRVLGCWSDDFGGGFTHSSTKLTGPSGQEYLLDNTIIPAELCKMTLEGEDSWSSEDCLPWHNCEWVPDDGSIPKCRLPEKKDSHHLDLVGSLDPNDKIGFQGSGDGQFVSGEKPVAYTVFFENLETATAPAQEVVIEDQLDIETLDFNTFSLGEIKFGNTQIEPPSGLWQYTTEVDLRPGSDLIVKIEAKLDIFSGLLTWTFASIDPATGKPPEDTLAGFLPPNVNPPEGEGHVIFTVNPKEDLETGTEIRNMARIVFDVNPPINTPEWLNTIDNTNPTSQVLPLAPTQTTTEFEVYWSGTDDGAGLRDYTIFVSEDGDPYTEWLSSTSDTSGTFSGKNGKTYAFYSIARDHTSNLEEAPAGADAITTVVADLPPSADAGPDQTRSVGPDCIASVTLDGSGSSDPDGDPLTYMWSWDGGSAAGAQPTTQLPLGVHTIKLVVNDGNLNSEPDYVTITVNDDTPPAISLIVSPDTLWPPNHKMVLISVEITVSDNCDPDPVVELESITMNEGEETDTFDPEYDSTASDGHTVDDIQVEDDGTIYLRAERAGTGTGRIYTITYAAVDASGNRATDSATVTVPHNQQ